MPKLSHFDEKGGVVKCPTPWGSWWQTLDEVFIEVILTDKVRSRDIAIKCTNTEISCTIAGKELFQVHTYLPTFFLFLEVVCCNSSKHIR
jgi:CS domain.